MSAPERIWVDLEVNSNGPMTAYRHIGSWPGARHEYILATPEALAAAPEVQRLIAEAVAREREANAAIADTHDYSGGVRPLDETEIVAQDIAYAIRNRKETT